MGKFFFSQRARSRRDYWQPTPHLITPSPNIARLYFNLDVLLRPPFRHVTLTLHVGGSTVYRDQKFHSHDFDGIMVLPTLQDILRVVCSPSALAALLMVTPEAGTDKLALIAQQCLTDRACFHFFEGVRFSGTTELGKKKSIKILSFSYLQTMLSSVDEPCPLPILSLKDRRQYSLPAGRWRVQPVTSDPSGSVHILHDADIFLPRYSSGNHVAPPQSAPAFGCTMDLFLTSHMVHRQGALRWVALLRRLLGADGKTHSDATCVYHVMFQKIVRVSGSYFPADPLSVFARSAAFSARYRHDLAEKLGLLDVPLGDVTCGNDDNRSISLLWPPLDETLVCQGRAAEFWDTATSPSPSTLYFGTTTANPVLSNTNLCTAQTASVLFSQNSSWGTCQVDGNTLFWKRSSFAEAELLGADLLFKFLPHRCLRSVGFDNSTSPPTLFFPFMHGDTMAQIRLHELRLRVSSNALSTSAHAFAMSSLLDAAATRSDDILRCWKQSMLDENSRRQQLDEDIGIHRFFVDRLRGDARMLEFYRNGMSWGRFHLTFTELITAKICINGRYFPSLSSLFRQAEVSLEHARQHPNLRVVGHGDLHGGNVIVCSVKQPQAALIYVDYEAVGRHSPWLDIAKPLYNDCFFAYMYADLLEIDLFDSEAIYVQLNGDILDIQFTPSSSKQHPLDPLGRALFEILANGLLQPFQRYMDEQGGAMKKCFEDDSSMLSHALLACALLTRNFISRPDMFFANLTIGVTLSQLTDKDSLIRGIYDLL